MNAPQQVANLAEEEKHLVPAQQKPDKTALNLTDETPTATTLVDAIEAFLRDVGSGHSPATVRTYRFVLSQFSRYLDAVAASPKRTNKHAPSEKLLATELRTDWAISFIRQLANGGLPSTLANPTPTTIVSSQSGVEEVRGKDSNKNAKITASPTKDTITQKGAAKASIAVYAATLLRFYRWCSLEQVVAMPSDELERLAMRLRELRGKQTRTIINKVPADEVVEALLTQARLNIDLLRTQATQLYEATNGVGEKVSTLDNTTDSTVTLTTSKRGAGLNRHDNLRHYLQAHRNLALVETLKSSGARVSEICNLTRGDLDASNHRARVVGKGDKERWIYFSPQAWEAVQSYIGIRSRLLSQVATGVQIKLSAGKFDTGVGNATDVSAIVTNLEVTKGKKKSRLKLSDMAAQPVFSRHDRRAGLKEIKPLTPRTVQRSLWELVERAELEAYITPHKFRHWFATKMLAATGDLAVTQDLLGHANPATTRIYAQVSENRKQEAHRQLFNNNYNASDNTY